MCYTCISVWIKYLYSKYIKSYLMEQDVDAIYKIIYVGMCTL